MLTERAQDIDFINNSSPSPATTFPHTPLTPLGKAFKRFPCLVQPSGPMSEPFLHHRAWLRRNGKNRMAQVILMETYRQPFPEAS